MPHAAIAVLVEDSAQEHGLLAEHGLSFWIEISSRLDMFFPENQVHVVVEPGQRVRAGETVIAFTGHPDKGME